MNKKVLILSVLFILIFTGCHQDEIATLKQQELFSIDYGTFENELTMFSLGTPGDINTNIYMQDGFFFIANGEGKKVMQFTSYGDIIGIYYNPDFNPVPSFISEVTEEHGSQKSTQQSLEYPFSQLGKITADSFKNWYVVDTLPPERQEYDSENTLALRQVILRFSQDGTYIDYLGQEGPGGTPFPYIKNLYTTSNNEIVVICQTIKSHLAFWFSSEGYLKYTIPVTIDSLPRLEKIPSENQFISLDAVVPDYTYEKLYVKVNYHKTAFDTSTRTVSGIDFVESRLYTLDLEKKSYTNPLIIPAYEKKVQSGYSSTSYLVPYSLLGITESGWIFFMLAEDDGFIVQIVQLNGQRILHRHIPFDFEAIKYHSISLSPKGIISALQIEEDKAKVSWWRTDSLIESLLK